MPNAAGNQDSSVRGNHPAVARSLNNVGIAYQTLGKAAKALEYLEQALEMRKALHTENHPAVANSLNNVGAAYYYLGRLKEAIQSLEQALAVPAASFLVLLGRVGMRRERYESSVNQLAREGEYLRWEWEGVTSKP